MAIDGELLDRDNDEGLYIGADHSVTIRIFADKLKTTIIDTGAWTLLTLDIRKKDTNGAVLLTKNGTRSGTFHATPGTNTELWTFTLTDDDLAAATFTGDQFIGRYSIWRKDAGSEQPVRYGDCTITRTTQT